MDAFRAIEREYEIKKSLASRAYQARKDSIYISFPRLKEIDSQIRKLGIETGKIAISYKGIDKEQKLSAFIEKINTLKAEKAEILSSEKEAINLKYECEICKDTGFVTNGYESTMCSCMKQKLINAYYNKFNTFKIDTNSFSNFDESLYSSEASFEKYGTKVSPRDNIKKIREISQNFIDNFKSPSSNNLLFIGTTGVGKTFLSGCIANEILKMGHTVIYQTAPILLDSIFEFKYGSKSQGSKDLYESLYKVDLLIIDDLGTENPSSAKFAELFAIINSRLLNPNTKTIISTNFDLEKLSKLYDDRLISRFIGNYKICKFYGDDIRLKNIKK